MTKFSDVRVVMRPIFCPNNSFIFGKELICLINSLLSNQFGRFQANGWSDISEELKSATVRISFSIPPASARRITSSGVEYFLKFSQTPVFSKVFFAG